MKYILQILVVAGISFIGPNTQALLSNAAFIDMDNAGFQCTLGYQKRQINIHYYQSQQHNIACDVSYQKNYQNKKKVWSAQRNHFLCEDKASSIALRLKDRGWQCQTAGLKL